MKLSNSHNDAETCFFQSVTRDFDRRDRTFMYVTGLVNHDNGRKWLGNRTKQGKGSNGDLFTNQYLFQKSLHNGKITHWLQL